MVINHIRAKKSVRKTKNVRIDFLDKYIDWRNLELLQMDTGNFYIGLIDEINNTATSDMKDESEEKKAFDKKNFRTKLRRI